MTKDFRSEILIVEILDQGPDEILERISQVCTSVTGELGRAIIRH